MYAVMWLCCAARRLVETGPFCCFPRGGWPWRLEPAEWVPGGCRGDTGISVMCSGVGVFVAVSVIQKDQDLISWPNLLFFLCVFLPLRHSFWHILSSQTDNKVNSASGCHLLANVIQHQTRLLYSVTLRWRRKQNTTLYYTRSTKNKGQYWLTKVWFFFLFQETYPFDLTWCTLDWWNDLLLLLSPLASVSLLFIYKPAAAGQPESAILFEHWPTVGTKNASELFESRRIIIPLDWQWCLLWNTNTAVLFCVF